MYKCTELTKWNGRSLVTIREMNGELKKCVVCSNFNNSKAFGNKWDWGHYFEMWNYSSEDECIKAATMYLYDVEQQKIPYDRMSELATLFKDGLLEDDEEEAMKYFKKICEMTKEEMEYFGIKDEIFELVEVTLTRQLKTTIKILVPEGTSSWDYEDYIENKSYLEPDEDESDEWEVDSSDVIEEKLTREECSRYDDSEVWNAVDYQ